MNERESRKQAREKTNKGLLPLSLLVIGKRRHISDKSKHILPLTLRVELVPQLVEVLVARLVEFPEPRVRPPVKRPVQQLVELPELLDHRPLELLVRQLAEGNTRNGKKTIRTVRQLSQSDNLFMCTNLICVALMYAV